MLADVNSPLFRHQEEAIGFLEANQGNGLLAHEPGLGKTRTVLEAFQRLKSRRPDHSFSLFVVAPISLLEAAWHEDLKRFTPELGFWNIHKNGLPSPIGYNVYAINYEAFQYTDKVQKIVTFLRTRRWMIALDESSKMKNPKASQTKNLLEIRNLFDFRVAMSGTPAPNSESEYWAQIRFCAPDGAVPKSFNQFRNTYFHLRGRMGQEIDMKGVVPTREVMQKLFQQQGAQYAITAQKREELFRAIGPWIHARKKEDCLDLPDQLDEKRIVRMGPNQARAYRQMKNQLVAEIEGQDVVAQVALSKLMKLREITSGFAFAEDGQLVETECPKMAALEDILDELGDKQAIIWGNFTWEIERIMMTLCKRAAADLNANKKMFEHATLYGKTVDREDSINGFIQGRYRYLVANPHSAAHGLTFVNCSEQIFFSLDYSWESYEQARGRTHRAGQTNKCTYYHLLADGTIDEEILSVLKRKGNAQEIVFKLRGDK